MIKAIHIKLLLLFSLSILFGHSAFAQNQQVCVGQEVTYHMYGFDGSSVLWRINYPTPVSETHIIDRGNPVAHPPHSDPNYFKDSFTHTWTTAGTYTIQVVESNNSCDSDVKEFTVEVHALPDNTLTLSDPTICPSSSASIVLANSVSGVNYQLRLDSDGSTVGGVIAGTGADITFNVAPAVSTIYNVIATNANSCSAELADKANVTVEDVTPPVTPTLADVTGECSATASAPTTTDACAGVITGTTTDPLTYSTQGTHVITWSFTDGNGQTITANQNVIINDVTPPSISCVADIDQVVDAGSCGAIVNYVTPVGTDNCSGVTTAQTAGLPSGSIFPIGITTNTFEVTDISGQKSICSFNVTITKENNIAVVDVSGSLTPDTSDGSDNNNGNHCPDLNGLQAVIAPSGNVYSAGTSKVQFRVDRLCDTGEWSFAYTIGASAIVDNLVLTTNSGVITNNLGVISAPATADYILFTLDVFNVVGSVLEVEFTISDGGAKSAIKDAILLKHEIEMMPLIGGFD